MFHYSDKVQSQHILMTGCQKKPKFLLWHDLRFPDGTLILLKKKERETEKGRK